MSDSLRPVNKGGVVVLSVFGGVWALAGLALAGASVVVWAVPVLLAVGGIFAGTRLARHSPVMPEAERRRIGRLVGLWSGAEGLGIFAGNSVLMALHRVDLIAAMVCTMVGLHFFPLAQGIPLRIYFGTAVLMTLLGLGGLIVSSLISPALVAFGAAAIIWGTLLGILLPARAALRATA